MASSFSNSRQDFQKLRNRLNSGQVSERLRVAISDYEIKRFYALSPEAAVAELREVELEQFKKYAGEFMSAPQGVDLLNQFFIAQLHSQPITWETLKKAVGNACDYPRCESRIKVEVCREGEKLFQETVDSHKGALEAFRAYVSIMETLNVPDLEDRKEQQRKYFWEKMELSDLSRKDMLSCQNDLRLEKPTTLLLPSHYERMCATFNLANLMSMIRKAGMDRPCQFSYEKERYEQENEYLGAVYQYFTKLSKCGIKPAWKKTAVPAARAMLDETVRNEYRWGDAETFAVWVQIASLNKIKRLFQQIIEIRRPMYIQYNPSSYVTKTVLDLESEWRNDPQNPDGEEISCLLADDLARHWHKYENDSSHPHVPLDTWLIIGTLRYGREDCFHVFDGAEPKASILKDKPDIVAQDSKLLNSDAYYNAGVKYVNEDGQERLAVAHWLKKCSTRGNRVPPKVEEKKSGLGGLFGGRKRDRLNSDHASKQRSAAVSEDEIGRFHDLSPEAAAAELREMNQKQFGQYARRIRTEPWGVETLSRFYIARLYSQPTVWETLNKVVNDASAYLPYLPKLKDEVCREGEKLFQKAVDSHQGALEAFQTYASLLENLNVPDLEERKEWQRKYFWDHMELSNLSREDLLNCQDGLLMKEPDPSLPPPCYEKMRVALDLANLVRMIRQHEMDKPGRFSYVEKVRHENEYLEAVHSCFAHLSKCGIEPEWKKAAAPAAQAVLDETVWNDYRWGDVETFATWVRIASLTKSRILFQRIISIRADMYIQYDPGKPLRSELLALEFERDDPVGREIVCIIADDLARRWHKHENDISNPHVPLDTWLIIGMLRYGREDCFQVFDRAEAKARILMDNPDDVVRGSKMLGNNAYYEAGLKYVNEKGQERRAVANWLKKRGARGN